jgi:hypothetical protein
MVVRHHLRCEQIDKKVEGTKGGKLKEQKLKEQNEKKVEGSHVCNNAESGGQ